MKNLNLYTRLKGKRKATIEKIIELTLEWCVDKWGVNGRRTEALITEVNWDEKISMGDYDYKENLITIYPKANLNIRDLVDTVIHEFTHQRQKMSSYHKVLKSKGYSSHPLEIEAFATAKENRKACWHELKKTQFEKSK